MGSGADDHWHADEVEGSPRASVDVDRITLKMRGKVRTARSFHKRIPKQAQVVQANATEVGPEMKSPRVRVPRSSRGHAPVRSSSPEHESPVVGKRMAASGSGGSKGVCPSASEVRPRRRKPAVPAAAVGDVSVDEEDVAALARLRQASAEARRSSSVVHPRRSDARPPVEPRTQRLAVEWGGRRESPSEKVEPVVPSVSVSALLSPAVGLVSPPPPLPVEAAAEAGHTPARASLRGARSKSMIVDLDGELEETPVVRARTRRRRDEQVVQFPQDQAADVAKLLDLQAGRGGSPAPRRSSEPVLPREDSVCVSAHGLVGDDDLAMLAGLMALRSQAGSRASDDMGALKGVMKRARDSMTEGALVGQDDLALLDELMAMRTKRASMGAAAAGPDILRDLDALRSSRRDAGLAGDDGLAVLGELMALRSAHNSIHPGLVGANDLALLDELMALRSSSPGFTRSTGGDVALLAGLMSASRAAALGSAEPILNVSSQPVTRNSSMRSEARRTSRFDPDAYADSFD